MYSALWTERYRPGGIGQMSLSAEARKLFDAILEKKRTLPNLLLYGPPGSGKTSMALILSQALSKRESILEMNASSDREISVIRGKIKTFASTKAHKGEIKIIIMDECDYLTPDAQHCLRRVIEDTHRSTRFIFITNYLNRVIDPIKSRLTQVKLSALEPIQCEDALLSIQEKESLFLPKEIIRYIVEQCKGDMRRCITLLQTAGRCNVSPEEYKTIIADLTGQIPEEIISSVFQIHSIGEVISVADNIVLQGYSALSFVQAVSQHLSLFFEKSFSVLSLVKYLSLAEENIISGGTDYIQILNILGQIAKMNTASDSI